MSATIHVRVAESDGGWAAQVEVRDDDGSTRHLVRVPRAAYDRLTGGRVAPQELVRASFEFLLEREPKESVLREFELTVIGRYFPEYEDEIRRRLAR